MKHLKFAVSAMIIMIVLSIVILLVVENGFDWIVFHWGSDTMREIFRPDNPADYPTTDENGILHIYEDTDWQIFAAYVQNGYADLHAALEADITVEDRYPVENYAGCLDGQGHTIEISADAWSLFYVLDQEGIIENLTVETVISPMKGVGAGGIIFHNYGTIRGCDVYGSVTGYNYVGGIARSNLGVIENCNNYAAITSLETGETWETKGNWAEGYGAGGIAGVCGTGDTPGDCVIINCCNYGEVTAEVYAGGIVASLYDKTNGNAPASSVQELVQNGNFAMPPEDRLAADEQDEPGEGLSADEQDEPGEGLSADEQDELKNGLSVDELEETEQAEPAQHYSLANCTNYGTVTVNRRVDPRTYWDTKPAGICADLHWGELYRCVNRGTVQFAASAPEYNEKGYAYTNRPMAITENMGFAPTGEHHIIECVSLEGTISGTMRHENIMELSEEELSAWEAGDYTGEYISDNWAFDLAEAAEVCRLEPLGVNEKAESAGEKNVYLCEEFALYLPDFLEIEEVCLPEEGAEEVCYALHIQVSGDISEEALSQRAPKIAREEECYILRKTADVRTALAQALNEDGRGSPFHSEDWFMRYFIHNVYNSVRTFYFLEISPLNPPFDDAYRVKYADGKRIYMESGIPDESLYAYMQEGDHTLGNALVMPLEGVFDDGVSDNISAKWLFFFTRKETNIHPSRAFMRLVEEGFYPLEGDESFYVIEEGDTLWDVARECTGDARNWRMLAGMNGISEPDAVFPGDMLLVPRRETWEKKVGRLSREWIYCYDDLPELADNL